MKTYAINKTANVFRIGAVTPCGRGSVLRSTGLHPQVEVVGSPEFTTRAGPRAGDYYVKYSNGYETTVTEQIFKRDFVEAIEIDADDQPQYSTEEEVIEAAAKEAYAIHYLEQDGDFDNGFSMPTVEELFTDEEHADRAASWLSSAKAHIFSEGAEISH